jgi:hypothetical protein
MAINSSVRWFLSTMPGAPELRDVAGGIINVLDACLINGFASKTINTLVVADGVATATISGGHDYEKHAVIKIAGATPSDLNGDWRIASVPDGSTLTFAAPGLADGSATGTITAIRATPGHWQKAFADTNKGAYRSTHEDATGLYLRVDDTPTGTNSSPVRGYETMTGVDTGTNPFPTTAQAPDFVWRRTNTASAGSLPRPWALVADEAWFAFLPRWNVTAGRRAPAYFFGDAARRAPLDAFACGIGGNATSSPLEPTASGSGLGRADGTPDGQYWARNTEQAVGSVPLGRFGSNVAGPYLSGGESFPAARSGGYLWRESYTLHEAGTGGRLRGLQPGALQGLTAHQTTIGDNQIVLLDPSADRDRPLLVVPACYVTNTSTYIAFDLWGPWR